MPKNIIVLMEGSGNAFDCAPSNVTRTLESVALGKIASADPYDQQLAIWDYGVGTRIRALKDALPTAQRIRTNVGARQEDLKVLNPPSRPWWLPGAAAKLLGLAIGSGLESNVTEAVQELARCHEADDRLYLFGFSRGAFTVRVLSALLCRFGLPERGAADVRSWVSSRLHEMQTCVTIDHVHVPTYFLGLWDTVKAYGFIRPVRYFHLRHNPGVRNVRHALALDEKRSWYQCTTWGGLDRDRKQLDGDAIDQPRRCKPVPNPDQVVEEVWFRGCHSDIGGGEAERTNAEVTLRWMLQEAQGCGLALNVQGKDLVNAQGPQYPIVPTESWTFGWQFADYIPRLEINNDYAPARLRFACRPTGLRIPGDMQRNGRWKFHPLAQ